MVRIIRLSLIVPLLVLPLACVNEQQLGNDFDDQFSGESAWQDGYAARYRAGMVITDNGDGTWDGQETAVWTDDLGDVLCDIVWDTSGTVDTWEACEGCEVTWDVTCSGAIVLSEPGSCGGYSNSLDTPAQFWVGYLPGVDGGQGTFMTGDVDLAADGGVYWGDSGTASFDGAVLAHDTTWDLSSGEIVD